MLLVSAARAIGANRDSKP